MDIRENIQERLERVRERLGESRRAALLLCALGLAAAIYLVGHSLVKVFSSKISGELLLSVIVAVIVGIAIYIVVMLGHADKKEDS